MLMLVILLSTAKLTEPRNHRWCDNSMFCSGKLLHAVQTEQVLPTQTDFLYMKAKLPPEKILSDFEKLWYGRIVGSRDKVKIIKKFLDENFEDRSALEKWIPEDWKRRPALVKKLEWPNAVRLALMLNDQWTKFGRAITSDAYENSAHYSIIPTPHPFFVSRFEDGETTVTDSYWINKGLLVCGMYESARKVLMNHVFSVRRYRHAPKANRVYYAGRSEAPLLTPMADDYVRFTSDWKLLRKILATLEIEFDYWIRKHTSLVQTRYHVFLAAFKNKDRLPRPETYAEDWMQKVNLYGVPDENYVARLFWGNTGTDRRVVPVYLNSVLEWNARLLAQYCRAFEMPGQARIYERMSKELKKTVNVLLLRGKNGRWADYTADGGHVDGCSPLSLSPLWTGTGKDEGEVVLAYLDECSGGLDLPMDPVERGILVSALASSSPDVGREVAQAWLDAVASGPLPASYYWPRGPATPARSPIASTQDTSLLSAAVSLYLFHLYPDIDVRPLKMDTPDTLTLNRLLLFCCLLSSFASNVPKLFW